MASGAVVVVARAACTAAQKLAHAPERDAGHKYAGGRTFASFSGSTNFCPFGMMAPVSGSTIWTSKSSTISASTRLPVSLSTISAGPRVSSGAAELEAMVTERARGTDRHRKGEVAKFAGKVGT